MIQPTRVLRVNTTQRVETGPVAFEYSNGYCDWDGLFIRGDEAIGLSLDLKTVIGFLVSQVSDAEKVNKGGIPLALAVTHLRELKELIDNNVNQVTRKTINQIMEPGDGS